MSTPAELWERFIGSGVPAAADAVGASYTSWQFGYEVEMGNELVELVLSGRKRATAGAQAAYEMEGEPVPAVGDFSVVTDGTGAARCVIRTTAVEIVPFDQVDEAHAFAEGEGDRSLEYWQEGHRHFFSRELESMGLTMEDDLPVVCERFDVVYHGE